MVAGFALGLRLARPLDRGQAAPPGAPLRPDPEALAPMPAAGSVGLAARDEAAHVPQAVAANAASIPRHGEVTMFNDLHIQALLKETRAVVEADPSPWREDINERYVA